MKPIKFSKAEVDQYFSGDRIQCLICGKTYKRLAIHIYMHDLTEDDYRELYGLPWRRGLCGIDAFKAYSNAMHVRIGEGYMPPCNKENRAKAHTAIREHGMRTQPFKREICRENISHSNGREQWPDYMFQEIVRRILTGRTLPEVCTDNELPRKTWFRKYAREHPEEKQLFLAQLNELPFKDQATIRYGMQKRFWAEITLRRQRGETDYKIAAATGVSVMTCNRVRRQQGIE